MSDQNELGDVLYQEISDKFIAVDSGNEFDQVSHPRHYNQYTGFEVIDVCEQLRAPDGTGNFNRGNAFKYLARAGWKKPEKHVEDLEKAVFYIQREIDRINKELVSDTPACPSCGDPMWKDQTEKNVYFCAEHNGPIMRDDNVN
jgi:hypothetical protein